MMPRLLSGVLVPIIYEYSTEKCVCLKKGKDLLPAVHSHPYAFQMSTLSQICIMAVNSSVPTWSLQF